ncbi:MAG: alginate export family protein [Saonia sp.]
MKVFVYIPFFLLGFGVLGQDKEIQFSLLRQNDDISALKFKEKKSVYEQVKWIPLGKNAELSFGGSYRFQTEAFVNEQFNSEADQNDSWFLNRLMLHSHLKLSDNFQFFAELNSSTINSKNNLSPVDKDELSVNQLFATYNFTDSWSFLVGRQNLRLGSGRLVDVREGPNVRLSFDMAHLQFQNNNISLSGFFAVPVQQQAGVFDNDFLSFTENLAGLYITKNWSDTWNADLYILRKREDGKTWNSGTADDNRTSLGVRYFGSWKGFRFNNEFVYQLGNFGEQDIRAWTVSFNVERSMQWLDTTINLGIKTEAISGDKDANDNTLNTFDALYPRGAYFGRVARFGPSNLIDIHPYIDTSIGAFYAALDYVAFWRFSTSDGVYGPPLVLDYPSLNNNRFIGHQIGTITGWNLNNHMTFELETNLIFPGSFLAESGLGNTLFHTVLTLEFKY